MPFYYAPVQRLGSYSRSGCLSVSMEAGTSRTSVRQKCSLAKSGNVARRAEVMLHRESEMECEQKALESDHDQTLHQSVSDECLHSPGGDGCRKGLYQGFGRPGRTSHACLRMGGDAIG